MRHARFTRVASRRLGTFAITAAVATVAHSPVYAQTAVSWVGTTGDYNTGANWSSGVTPTNAADEFLMINNGGTAQVTADGEGAFLHLGLQPGDTGNLYISAGTLTLGELRVGGRDLIPFPDPLNLSPNGGGTGSVIQTGGTVNVTYSTGTEPPNQSLYIGDAGLASGNTANGSYHISGGTLNVGIATNDQIVIGTGVGTQGSFLQDGNGTVTTTGNLFVGRRGATATYTMAGGSLTTGSIIATPQVGGDINIGDGENNTAAPNTTGIFTQTGGAVTANAVLFVGKNLGTGSYSITGGTLNAANINVGAGGVGTFTQGNTTTNPNVPVVVKFSVAVGYTGTSGGAPGTYLLNSGTLAVGNTSGDVLAVGNNPGSVGTFVQMPGTTVTTTGDVNLGRNNSTGNNLYDMQGGSLTVGRDLIVAGAVSAGTTAAASNGTFSQSPGTTLNVLRNLNVGIGGTASGTYLMSGGTLNMTAASSAVIAIGNGTGTVGTFTQTGGILNDAGTGATLDVGRFSGTSAGQGTYNLSGTGVLNATLLRLNVNPLSRVNIAGGTAHIGALTLNAGTATLSGGTTTITGVITTSTGTLAITGGTIVWPTVANGLTLNSGGTLRTAVDLTIPSPVNLGNATVQVDAGTTSLTGSISSSGRTLTKTGPGTLVITGTQSHTANSAFTNNAGTLTLDTAGAANLTVNANAGTTNFRNAAPTYANIKIASGAVAAITPGGTRTLTTAALTATGTLDVADDTFDLTQTGSVPLTNIRNLLQAGLNGGTWTGTTGITSSVAAANPGHGLSYGQFGSLIEVKYTWFGDINYDGKIDADDYALLDRSFATGTFATGASAGWVDGDFNYDGIVTSADYLAIDTALAHQSGHLDPAFLTTREAQFGPAYVAALTAAVPEPASLALLGLALPLLARQRRRQD